MKIFKLLVCGGRDFSDRKAIFSDLTKIHNMLLETDSDCKLIIIHGRARGADSLAGDWAYEHNIETEEYPVSDTDWRLYGKSAGYRRNARMLAEGNPDAVLAYPGGNGTKMMVDISRKAGKHVIERNYDEK